MLCFTSLARHPHHRFTFFTKLNWMTDVIITNSQGIFDSILDLNPIQIGKLITLISEKELVTSLRSWWSVNISSFKKKTQVPDI